MALNFEHTRQLCRFIILLSTLILYMCICAAIYSLLEKENDRTQYNLYQGLKKSYKRKYNLSEDEFIKFVKDASIMYKRGYMGEYRDYWNFYHSFWFTITVVTTIGKPRFHILSSYILIIVLVVGYFEHRSTHRSVECEVDARFCRIDFLIWRRGEIFSFFGNFACC